MLTLYPETLLNSFISGCFVDLLLFYVCITMSLNKNSSASSILGNPFACVFVCRWLGTGVGVHSLALLWLWRTFILYCCEYGYFPGHLQQREVSSAPSLLRDAVFFFIINEYWICKKKIPFPSFIEMFLFLSLLIWWLVFIFLVLAQPIFSNATSPFYDRGHLCIPLFSDWSDYRLVDFIDY